MPPRQEPAERGPLVYVNRSFLVKVALHHETSTPPLLAKTFSVELRVRECREAKAPREATATRRLRGRTLSEPRRSVMCFPPGSRVAGEQPRCHRDAALRPRNHWRPIAVRVEALPTSRAAPAFCAR